MKIITRQEAIRLGLKRYFTGKVCPHGHVAERRVSSYVCVDCGLMHSRTEKSKVKKAAQGKIYYRDNKEKTLEYQREHRAKNRDRLAKRDQKYHLDNREKFNAKGKKWKLSPANFKTYAHQLIGHECRETLSGELETKCKKCDNWFTPKADSVMSRIKGINGLSRSPGAEHYLYCSDSCKENCDLFRVQEIPRSLRKNSTRSRCNQSTNKKALMELQTDNHGYNFCEKCGTKADRLEIHHSVMIADNYKEADNMAHQILLCIDCHKKPEAHCRD